MFEFFRKEPLYHYALDRFSLKSPLMYRAGQHVVHIGGGPSHNHPQEINLNVLPMPGVDVVANAARLPLGDATIDVAISCAVLEHVQDLGGTVREIERVLKPGGLVYIEIPFMQRYHIEDSLGATFEDYRRLTKTGLRETFDFCTPIDVGVCVGPVSSVCQIAFSLLRDLSASRTWHRLMDRLYYFFGNLVVWTDACLSEPTIRRSTIPSGIYFFGRKRDGHTEQLESSGLPNSCFPRDLAARMEIVQRHKDRVVVGITNISSTTWLRSSELDWGTVHVGLQRTYQGRFEPDYRRFDLPRDITPGETCEITIERAVLQGADAALVDLVIEGLGWFADHGSLPLNIPLRGNSAERR